MLRSLVVFALLILNGAGARAAQIGNLYSAQTIVTGTVEPERTRGFRAGLVDVVVKLTGDVRLADSNRLQPLLEQPHRFVEHFEYEDRMKGIPVRDEQGTRERPHYLRMRFKASEINQELERLGLSKWPPRRPMLAIWLGIKTATDTYVLSASGPKGYGQRAVIVETSERRGIPILLPEANSSKSAVTFDDISANNRRKMNSESHPADALLSGVLSLTEGGYWDITWCLTWQNRSRVWTKRGVSFDTALRDGLQTSTLLLSGNAPM